MLLARYQKSIHGKKLQTCIHYGVCSYTVLITVSAAPMAKYLEYSKLLWELYLMFQQGEPLADFAVGMLRYFYIHGCMAVIFNPNFKYSANYGEH